MTLLTLAIAPVLICLFYIYIRDKYEKEPLGLLFTGVIYGIIITAPIVHFENFVTLFIPNGGVLMESFYLSFIVAAFVEESFKFIVLYFLIWHNNNFNEPFDGIVYGAFISLGFAGIENVMYSLNSQFGGISTALGRGIISVPMHGVFGISMGFYFAMARFYPEKKGKYLAFAYFMPWLIHGVYDFIIIANLPLVMAFVIGYTVFFLNFSYKKMQIHLELSPFKPLKKLLG